MITQGSKHGLLIYEKQVEKFFSGRSDDPSLFAIERLYWAH